MQRNESEPLLKNSYPTYSEPKQPTEKEKGKEKETDTTDYLNLLPPELIENILKYFSFTDLLLLMQINKKINQVTNNMRADDVYDLREKMIRIKHQSTSKKTDGEYDIENPDETKSIIFKNKKGKKSSIAELLSRMKECKQKSQQIPTLVRSAERAENTVEYCEELYNRKQVFASTIIGGGIVGTGAGVAFNQLVLQNTYSVSSALIGGVSGVVLFGLIPTSLMCCSLYGISLFAQRNKQKADIYKDEVNNDDIHLLLKEISESNKLTIKK